MLFEHFQAVFEIVALSPELFERLISNARLKTAKQLEQIKGIESIVLIMKHS